MLWEVGEWGRRVTCKLERLQRTVLRVKVIGAAGVKETRDNGEMSAEVVDVQTAIKSESFKKGNR